MAQSPSLKAGAAPNKVSDPVHAMFCGVTQSGKTTLARLHARLLDRFEHNVIVYDPVQTGTLGGDWPENAVRFDDPVKLMRYLEKDDVNDAFVFIDEADSVLRHEYSENHWLLTRGRHKGLYVRVITQRPKLVPPTVRNQCSICYQFRLATPDAKEIAADFGHTDKSLLRGLAAAPDLSDFEKPIENPNAEREAQLSATMGDAEEDALELDMGDFLVLYSGSKAIDKSNVYAILNSRGHPLNKTDRHRDEE